LPPDIFLTRKVVLAHRSSQLTISSYWANGSVTSEYHNSPIPIVYFIAIMMSNLALKYYFTFKLATHRICLKGGLLLWTRSLPIVHHDSTAYSVASLLALRIHQIYYQPKFIPACCPSVYPRTALNSGLRASLSKLQCLRNLFPKHTGRQNMQPPLCTIF